MMKHRLAELIQAHGLKHWSIKARRDPGFVAWVNAETADLPDAPFMLKAYCATHGERPECPNGKLRKLKGIEHGWGFCGKTGVCECARRSVSASVAASKAADTDERRAQAQAKREATSLERYGHRNNGQTEQARAAHQQFYADAENIRNQLRKQVETMIVRYGITNAAHLPEALEKRRATLVNHHGVGNPMQSRSIAAKSLATRLQNGYAEEYYHRNYERLKARLADEFAVELLTPFEQYTGVADRPVMEFCCATCSRLFSWRLDYSHFPRCYVCHPTSIHYKSKEELAVLAYVRELGVGDVISGDRRLIAPYEIDILSEQYKVAIEYCGLYWHGEAQRPNRKYHLRKLDCVEKQGYRLLTIFSDEWLSKPDIVKSKIAHLFHRIEDRHFARKLDIVEVDNSIASCFYDASHVQGAKNANAHIALSDAGRIVAIMSFVRARASKGLSDNSFELVRFASLPYTSVVGGASRLFKYFTRTRHPAEVISYADRRWSDGELYRKLGFALEGINPPSYSYMDDHTKRYFRFNFRKDILKSVLGEIAEQTEWEIMQSLGYDRIWDCGTYRFVWPP